MIYTPVVVFITGIAVVILLYHFLNSNETFVSDDGDWQKVSGNLKQLSVSGNKVCGVTIDDKVLCSKFGSSNWIERKGKLKQLSISGKRVCGVNSENKLFCAPDINNKDPTWVDMQKQFTYIDIDGKNMCGIGFSNDIFCFKKGNWRQIPGSLKTLSLSGNTICGVNENNDLFCAENLNNPEWAHKPGKFSQVDISGNTICAVGMKEGKSNALYCAEKNEPFVHKPGEVRFISIDNGRGYVVGMTNDIQYTYDINNLEATGTHSSVISKKPEDILTEEAINNLKRYENKNCKYIANILEGEEKNYDLIKNYILVNNNSAENECYMKDISSIVEGDCSNENVDLYDPKVVDDIYPITVKDNYTSDTVPRSVCAIKFKTNKPTKAKMHSYLKKLDNALPKMTALFLNLTEAQDYNISVDEEIKIQDTDIQNKQTVLESKNKINNELSDRLAKEFDKTHKENAIFSLNANINELKKRWYNQNI